MLWVPITAFSIAVLSPIIWIPALRHFGAVDLPNFRSSHIQPTIRGVGLAPASGILVGVMLVTLSPNRSIALMIVFGSALSFAIVGLVEDLHGLPVMARAIAQLGLGTLTGLALCSIFSRPWWFGLIIGLGYATYVNVSNFMDGIDGISAFHGLIAGAHYFLVGVWHSLRWLELAGLILAFVFIAFAPWNLAKRKVFLGDVGSYLLGASVLGCGAGLWLATGEALLAVAPGIIYLADTISTLGRRALRRQSIFEAHRTHVYQLLARVPARHLKVAMFVATLQVICCGAAFWAEGETLPMLALLILAATIMSYVTLPSLLRRFSARGQARHGT